LSLLNFNSIADSEIDEVSSSEDEEAAQHALHGLEGGDLRPEGFFFFFYFSTLVHVYCRY
jgi:hypothetical protein